MAAGDHLIARRLVYEHHGIDCGGGRVIHYHGDESGKCIRETTMEAFLKGRTLEVVPRRLSPNEVLARARSRLGEARYRLVFNNCEHFVRWAAHGRSRSFQVENAGMALVVLAFLAASLLNGLLGAQDQHGIAELVSEIARLLGAA